MKIRNCLKTMVFGMVALAACFASTVNAAIITFQPSNPVYTVGTDPVIIKVVGRDFTPGTNGSISGGSSGGGLSIGWDPAILALSSRNLTFPGDLWGGNPGTLNASAGTLTGLSVASFTGTPLADFDIAELSFSFLGVGSTSTNIGISTLNVWADFDALVDMTPNAVGGSVTVSAVPLPPALVLFGFGIASLGAFSRRLATA